MNVARRWLNRVGGAFLFGVALAILALIGFRLTATMYPETTAIAHAGGRVDGRDYTNSLAAFDRAYANGFRTIEVDFQKTADDVVVCGHDWRQYATVPSMAEFERGRASDPLPACTVPELNRWLMEHPDVQLMSDAKSDAVAINTMLHDLFGDRLTAQAYTVEQLRSFDEIGISRKVLTLYRLGDRSRKVSELEALRMSGIAVDAIAMPILDAVMGTALIAKHWLDVPVLSHTINDCFSSALLWGFGVDAVYTDDLAPHGCG